MKKVRMLKKMTIKVLEPGKDHDYDYTEEARNYSVWSPDGRFLEQRLTEQEAIAYCEENGSVSKRGRKKGA